MRPTLNTERIRRIRFRATVYQIKVSLREITPPSIGSTRRKRPTTSPSAKLHRVLQIVMALATSQGSCTGSASEGCWGWNAEPDPGPGIWNFRAASVALV